MKIAKIQHLLMRKTREKIGQITLARKSSYNPKSTNTALIRRFVPEGQMFRQKKEISEVLGDNCEKE